MSCGACGNANPAGAHFCNECAAPLASACGACGNENPPGAKFCNGCGAPIDATSAPQSVGLERKPRDYTPKHLADKILQSKSALEGERKHVTVLFADVKGSMELAEQLGAEEWHRILERFFEILTEGVHRFEGTVNQYTGDGIMALFGAPIAHEDHAQRACYAALQLRTELRRYTDELRVSRGVNLAVRMGLNSGEVVVGKIGDDLRMDYTAQGHTVGLAQRMESIAESGQAFLTEHTASLVEGYFALRDLGTTAIKGSREPLCVYALEGLGEHRTRLDLSRARGFSKFVGRDHDMASLEAALEGGSDGHGTVVGVVAEAGTGKSRLCFEFAERCRARGVSVYEAHGLAHGKQMPLLPILELYRSFFGIGERDSKSTAREKIAGRLVLLDASLREELPVVFDMLGVGGSEDALPPVDPEAHERRIFRAIGRIVRADRSGSIILVEDLHWLDAASDGVLAQLIEAAESSPGLVLMNFRPEYQARWMQRSDYQQIALVPLGPDAIRELLVDLLGSHPSIAELPELIQERTAGNPYFIEEVVQTLVETAALSGRPGAYELMQPVSELRVPPTVQAVLAARIDRLAEREKQVLQVASVIGKRVPWPVLSRAASFPEMEITAAVAILKEREFLYEAAIYPELEYAFKHPLTEQVAYESQLRESRARSHAAVAAVIEEVEVDRLDESAARLAKHWAEAGEPLTAAAWHRRAAAWIGYTNLGEAAHHWRQVLACTDGRAGKEAARLTAEACREVLAIGFRLQLPGDELRALVERCRVAVAELADSSQLGHALYRYAISLNLRGELAKSLAPLNEALAIARQQGDLSIEVGALCTLQDRGLLIGELEEAHDQCNYVIDLVDEDPRHFYEPGLSSYLECLVKRGLLRCEMGEMAEGQADMELAIRLCDDESIPQESLILCLVLDVHTDSLFGAKAQTLARSRRIVELAENVGSPFWLQMAHLASGHANAALGRWDEACVHLERGRAIAGDSELRPWNESVALSVLADAYGALGRLADARVAAELAVEAARERGMLPGECRGQIALARVSIAEGGTDSAAIEAALVRAEELVEKTNLRAILPFLAEARSEWAQIKGDKQGASRSLADAHRLFTEVGALGHAERLAEMRRKSSV